MKSFIGAFCVLLISLVSCAYGQGGGNGNGNNGNGNGNGGTVTSPCGVTLQVGDVITGCNGNGLNCPYGMSLVVRVLKAAKDALGTTTTLSLGQMIQEYHDCRCVITYQGGSQFLVNLTAGGGGGILVVLDAL